MPSPPSSDRSCAGPANLEELRLALAAGQRSFPGLKLGDLNGANLMGASLEGALLPPSPP
jgi:hypothetical protein